MRSARNRVPVPGCLGLPVGPALMVLARQDNIPIYNIARVLLTVKNAINRFFFLFLNFRVKNFRVKKFRTDQIERK